MPTVAKEIADQIKDGNGYYADDPRVTSIIEYDNAFGGVSYGLNYQGLPNRYYPSEFVRNPRVYWEVKTTRTQAEILSTLENNTHTLWAETFVDEVNKAFGVALKCRTYHTGGGPKGLTLNDGGSEAQGLASFHLAPELCHALSVSFESKLGRGFQVRSCVDALRNAGYGQAS